MIRETSLGAYNRIVESGLLGAQRRDVLRALVQCEPATAGEVAEQLALLGYGTAMHTTGRRLPELRDVGVIREHDPRKCKASGRRQIVWSVTGLMPVAQQKPPTRAQLLKKIDDLEHQVDKLKAQIPKQMRLL